ncbi:MAG: iron-containing alcohol dehydrogenase, partial [Butyricicoccaceae bacterium]
AYLSPQASPYSDLFSQKAIELILNGYQYIGRNGPDLWNKKEFLLASNYAGIAFANTGYGPAYLLAGPLARRSSIPRGQVSLIVFRQILALYQKYKPVGKLNLLERQLADLLGTSVGTVWKDLDRLIATILPYQSLNELGVPHKALWDCMQEALQRRRSAMAHAYTELSENDILRIYEAAYE